MHPVIPRLVDLQQVDHKVAALRAELETLPKRVQAADAKLSGAKAALAAAKDAQARDITERKKIEFDVQQWKDRAKKYRDQSGAVKTNEAYKALQHEIANAEAEMAAAEDRQLVAMVAGEDAERLVRKAEADLRESETVVNAERKGIQALNIEKKKLLEAALAERAKALAAGPGGISHLYTSASPSGTTAQRWRKLVKANAAAAACACFRTSRRSCGAKTMKKCIAAKVAV